MKCRNIGKNNDFIFFGKDPAKEKTLLYYRFLQNERGAGTGYASDYVLNFTNPQQTVTIDSVTYHVLFDDERQMNGKFYVSNPSTLIGICCWTSEKIPSYAVDTDAVIASLTQRLSVLKGELWYQINYGLPLTDKYTTKAMFDSTINDIITSHPWVKKLVNYKSEVRNRNYFYSCIVESIFGDTFTVSNR